MYIQNYKIYILAQKKQRFFAVFLLLIKSIYLVRTTQNYYLNKTP